MRTDCVACPSTRAVLAEHGETSCPCFGHQWLVLRICWSWQILRTLQNKLLLFWSQLAAAFSHAGSPLHIAHASHWRSATECLCAADAHGSSWLHLLHSVLVWGPRISPRRRKGRASFYCTGLRVKA